MTLEIRERDFESFVATTAAIYEGEVYVAPMRSDLQRYLDPAKNPLMKGGGSLTYFTALRDGRLVGRITAHVHPASNALHRMSRGYFGFFDVADDAEAAEVLLGRAEAFVRAQGCDEIAGNFNLTAMQQVGVLTEGFENAPYTDMVWGPPHLPRLLEANGFERFFPMSTFEFRTGAVPADVLKDARTDELETSGQWRFAAINRWAFGKRMEEGRICLNDGFAKNPMFVPLTSEEFTFQAGEMMWVLDPTLAALAFYEDEPAGVVICIPDLNPMLKSLEGKSGLATVLGMLLRPKATRAVIILYSVREAFQGRGLNAWMLQRVLKALKARGYATCGVTWIADENAASLRQMEKLGATRLHRLHLFRKALIGKALIGKAMA